MHIVVLSDIVSMKGITEPDGDGLLLHTVSFPVGVVALYFEVLTVPASGSLTTTFRFSMSTWLAGMIDAMSSPRLSIAFSSLSRSLQARNRNLG